MKTPHYPNRFYSLDIMRGIAIVLMIEAHIRISTSFLDLQMYSRILAAPFFLIAAGIGYQLFLRSRIRRCFRKKNILIEALWRATILALVTTILFLIGSIIFPSTFEYKGLLKWNVFQVIAVGYIFGFFISNSISKKIISILIIFTLSFLINHYQIESVYFLTKGVFPLLPWLSYFIFGQIMYEVYKKKNLTLNRNLDLLIFSSIFFIFNLLILVFTYEFTSANRVYFQEYLMISSIFLLCTVIIIRLVDLKNKFKKIVSPFESIGKIAFTAYYLQMVLIIFSFYNVLKMPPTLSNFIMLIISIIILALFERMWKKYDYIFGLEWLLRKGTTTMINFTAHLINFRFNK